MATNAVGYNYEPLSAEKNEIRLLRISGGPDSTIAATISKTSLDEDPAFNALSYVWGNVEGSKSITLAGESFAVTENLFVALSHLVKDVDVASQLIWIDAVCINQNDVHERNHQVPLMGRIYSEAKAVYAWLGSGSKGVELGMRLARSMGATLVESYGYTPSMSFSTHPGHKDVTWLLDQRIEALFAEFRTMQQSDGSDELVRPLDAVEQLFSTGLPYWERVWTFQELLLATSAVLVYGGQKCRFADACELQQFFHAFDADAAGGRPAAMAPDIWAFAAAASTVDAFLNVTVVRLAATLHKSGAAPPMSRLTAFALATRFRRSWDPRDKIYGLLAAAGVAMPVEYNSPVAAVYNAVADQVLSSDVELLDSMLENAGRCMQTTTYPGLRSWATEWDTNSVSFMQAGGLQACDGIPDFPPAYGVSAGCLTCSCIVVDEVAACRPPSTDLGEALAFIFGCDVAELPRSATRTGELYATGEPLFDAAARLWIRDNLAPFFVYSRDGPAHRRFGHITSHFASLLADPRRSETADAFGTTMLGPAAATAMSADENSITAQMLRQGSNYVKRSAVFRTARGGGLLGLAACVQRGRRADTVRPGDLVCLVAGCHYPVVARRVGGGDDDAFELMGPCWVLGLMAGEAAEIVRDLGLKPRDIRFV